MRKDILKVIEDDEETIKVEFKGTFEDLFISFEAVSRAALEGIKGQCESKAQIQSAQIELTDRYLKVFMETNPSGLLVLYDQLTNGMIEIIRKVDNTQSKKEFLDAMMEIITKSFEKLKEDCDTND